jgi:hypothetical protein
MMAATVDRAIKSLSGLLTRQGAENADDIAEQDDDDLGGAILEALMAEMRSS